MARLNIPKQHKNEFDKTGDIIEITMKKPAHVCYKEETWKKQGWCEVNLFGDWGICSESCTLFGKKPDSMVSQKKI